MSAKATSSDGERRRPREVTGRTVLFCLVAFFGVVSVVNAVMIREAVSTFGGLETESSYKAGLTFAKEEAQAAAQDKRQWTVSTSVRPEADGQIRLDVTAVDAAGQPLAGYLAKAGLAHPTDARLDRRVDLAITSPGRYTARVPVNAGQWDLVIDLIRNDERLFRSRRRIVLPHGTVK